MFVRYIHRMAHSIRAVDGLRRVAEEVTKWFAPSAPGDVALTLAP